MSAFVWLDYSEREHRKMLDVIDLFREHDTRDELGIGSVRDAFADIALPWYEHDHDQSTVLSSRPVGVSELERLRVRSAEIAARARQAELNLVEPIERSDDNDGNIGKLAKTTLKRLASSVYWQGLSVWETRSFGNFSSTITFMRYLDRRRVLRKSYVRKLGSAWTVLNRLMKLWALESQAARALPLIP